MFKLSLSEKLTDVIKELLENIMLEVVECCENKDEICRIFNRYMEAIDENNR